MEARASLIVSIELGHPFAKFPLSWEDEEFLLSLIFLAGGWIFVDS